MDLLLNSTTIPYLKSSYDFKISINKYLGVKKPAYKLALYCIGFMV